MSKYWNTFGFIFIVFSKTGDFFLNLFLSFSEKSLIFKLLFRIFVESIDQEKMFFKKLKPPYVNKNNDIE